MRKFAALILALAIACSGLIAACEEPVLAHNYDNYSLFYCAKHRGNGWEVNHSQPDFLSPTQVRYYCRQVYGYGVEEQYWVIVNLPLDSNDSWRPWDYQRCRPYGVIACWEP